MLAARNLGDVTVRYRINGGPVQSADTSQWQGGERYGVGNGTYYHVVRGEVTGTDPGDNVRVWFQGGGARSDSFRYDAVSETGKRVLVLSAEDYTGASPDQPPGGPFHLSYYADALAANGVDFDVYDVDANGRTAPDNLGVLSHYDAVVWYTGDDVVTRETGWGPGNASRLAMQELLEVRDYVNEGGRVLYTGQRAGQQYTTALGTQLYDPFNNGQCQTASPDVLGGCLALSGSGDSQGDPIEYVFGAAISTPGGGSDPDTGDPFDVSGIDEPLEGLDVGIQRRRQRSESGVEFLVHRDRRLPRGDRPGGQLPAVRELAGGRVPERTLGPVRPAHRGLVHVVGSCRRGVQAPDANDHRPRGRRDACRSGRATTSSSTSTT